MNQQRNIVYTLRREVLNDIGVERKILDIMGNRVSEILDQYVPSEGKKEVRDLDGLKISLYKQFGVDMDFQESQATEEITDKVSQSVKLAYDDQKESLDELFPRIQKIIYLQTMDTQWKDHLKSVDKLKEGINLRAYAQKDPVIEYKKEAFNAFDEMSHQIEEETLEKIFKVSVVAPNEVDERRFLEEENNLNYQGAEESGSFSQDLQSGAIAGLSNKTVMEQGSKFRASQNDDQNLSRAQRRKLEKKNKSKNKIKI